MIVPVVIALFVGVILGLFIAGLANAASREPEKPAPRQPCHVRQVDRPKRVVGRVS